jgi:hypothetical protein
MSNECDNDSDYYQKYMPDILLKIYKHESDILPVTISK